MIFSCSLRPESHSVVLARELAGELERVGKEVDLVDLREVELPFCDADECYRDSNVVRVRAMIEEAASVTFATPIYNYEVGGATRNLVAVCGNTWKEKIVGFLCAAGGRNSYMSVMGLVNSMMLDFRCLVVPRFVYATRQAFRDGRLVDDVVQERVEELAGELNRLTTALNGV